MDETTNLDAGINASDEETLATDGTMSEELDTTDVETDEIETDDVIDQEALKRKRNAEKAKKMLAEKNEMKARIENLERDNAIKDLKLNYGEFDAEAVVEIKKQHPSLSYEDALLLHNSKTPQKPQPSNIGLSGMESRSVETATITASELSKLDPQSYSQTYDKIMSGKVKLVKG